ncbi:CRISPR-associated endonuclease Cas2 [Salinivibrio sp. ML323]|uniref:CRISPR-associated endonuclease Cas2 n=1 Tax=Salinivibrio sp. ML323 TaxID=1909474 RepID=UPI0009843A0F|nr:CRISPR-associated endonuclease Cas2 [Salinivibrio sp. ML323]OOE60287.1 CRISPR-associated endonuclease Cas2 [Salinivibrio sp. ML323]
MAKTTEVLVAYDIENNKTRTRLYNQLKDVGMIPVQKSVMWGRLLPADIKLAKRILASEIDQDTDKAFVLVSKLSENAKFYGLTPDFEEYDDHGIF